MSRNNIVYDNLITEMSTYEPEPTLWFITSTEERENGEYDRALERISTLEAEIKNLRAMIEAMQAGK